MYERLRAQSAGNPDLGNSLMTRLSTMVLLPKSCQKRSKDITMARAPISMDFGDFLIHKLPCSKNVPWKKVTSATGQVSESQAPPSSFIFLPGLEISWGLQSSPSRES